MNGKPVGSRGASFRAGRVIVCAGIGLALAACSVSEPLSVTSTKPAAGAPVASVALAFPAEGEPGTERRAFAAALTDAFAARGVTTDPDADLLADYSLSQGSAALGVERPQEAASRREGGPDWIDAPRTSRRFDRCAARELRGSLVVLERASGRTIYRGRGQATECAFDDAAMRALADRLVAEFLADN